jgi:hypothetical protein
MHSKHERLPTNLLILVSPRGFTAPAIAKASSYGIKTIALTQADSDLATEVLASLGVTAWDITDARLSVSANIPTEWLERDAHAVAQDDGQILFYSSGGSQLVTSETFNMAAMGQHLAAHPSWSSVKERPNSTSRQRRSMIQRSRGSGCTPIGRLTVSSPCWCRWRWRSSRERSRF